MGGKLVILSAPSGAGKSTIISYLLRQDLGLSFSVSATSRLPRGQEREGREYYFLSPEQFRAGIEAGDFLEYEEVYPGRFYGTLKSEVRRMRDMGENVIFDVDVAGGCRIKEYYGEQALSVFIQPPSLDELRTRLEKRGTDGPEAIRSRMAKAEYEMGFASRFDVAIVNDDLEKALAETLATVKTFLVR
ncbi:MAG: guanylate kinase [Tannerellaceae bacterium]|nr:guanylate kinase [Tannerellaceae bacterium]